jgi:hypothetical protein
MDDDLINTFEQFHHSVLEWQKSSMRVLGFMQTIEHNKILFHISERSVVADVAPLAYLDLVQEIEDGMVQAAVASLYERLRPLLQCRHRWSPLSAGAQSEIICLDFSLSPHSHIHVCAECTGYCIKSSLFPLPQCGKG